MKIFLNVLLFSLFAVYATPVLAQNVRSNEIVVVDGKKFIMHTVQTGETVYSLTKRFKVERSELEHYNPGLEKGPSIGDVLKIPYKKGADLSVNQTVQKGVPDGYHPYKIESRRETAYFIAKENGITVEELYAANLGIRRFKKGAILRIPYWNAPEPIEKEEEVNFADNSSAQEITIHQVVSGETLYSISKRYSVPEAEILALNPNANNLKAGAILNIPVKENVEIEPVSGEPESEFSGKYFEHIIESGETLWGTTRRYGISEAELKALNPILNTGFPAGAVLKIPVKSEAKVAQPVNNEAFEEHFVERGETLYGLSRKYDVSVLDLMKYNPVLENRNLVFGETVLIPVKNEVEAPIESDNIVISDEIETEKPKPSEDFYKMDLTVEVPEGCRPNQPGLFSNETYRVALFLPLYIEANDTLNREDMMLDSTLLSAGFDGIKNVGTSTLLIDSNSSDTTIEVERREEFKKFYGNSENFLQFYEGVLLALKKLKLQGTDIQLQVFDTQHNADSIRKFITQPDFLATDLIIGPIYPDVQRDVSQIAAKNRIPLVSPLASQSNLINSIPSYFQVNPSRDYLAVETAEMVAEEYYNSNFIVLKNGDYSGTPEGRVVDLLQEKFVNAGIMSRRDGVNFTIYDFKNEGPFGLRRIMSKSKENVVLIPSSDEGSLSISISNVNNLASEYSITLIGTHRFPSYQSIQLDHYHNLKLKFVAPYWVDYSSPATINFVEQFKREFNTEPDNFGFQGYDVTTYFVEALASFGRDFANCLPYFHTNLVQGNYHFEKYSEFGGYMNQGVSVISYTRDYEVKRERIKGQPRLVIAETRE